MTKIFFPGLAIVFWVFSLQTHVAQDEPVEVAVEVVADPTEYPLKSLRYELVPLTAEEIEEQAQLWQERLKTKATELAKLKISVDSGEELEKVLSEKNALLERFQVVLDGWEIKGGDPSSMRKYAAAMRVTDLRIDDPSAAASAISRWVKSEDGAMKFAKKIVLCLVILVLGIVMSSMLSTIVVKAIRRTRKGSALLIRFASIVIKRLILVAAILVALSTIGVNVGALVAVIGGGAFILGFALQDTLSNFANGIMLMVYRPFDVGDAVEVGGVSGSVDSVSLVNTTIRSWDNKMIIVPNKSVWGQTITNITGADQRRVDMVFSIGYGDNSEKAHSILEKILADHDLILKDPAPIVRLHELADSAVNFVCRPWAKTSDYWSVYWDVTKKVKSEFDAQGISIPFPQRDVHLHQAS